MTVATSVAPGAPDDQPPSFPAADEPPIRLSTPTDLAVATPYLLRFHPTNSVVVLAFRAREPARQPANEPSPRGHGMRFHGVVRLDLPEPDDPDAQAPARLARVLLDPVTCRGATAVAILGYGPADRVDPFVPVVHDLAQQRGLWVKEALRVDGDRWWSYTCANPRCCPPEGTAFDPATSRVAVRCAVAGLTALPGRDDLAALVAPPDQAAEQAIAAATDRAILALLAWLESVPETERAEAIFTEGHDTVRTAITRYGEGDRLTDEELAGLTVMLTNVAVRDTAWAAITTQQPHLSLWTDVVRRADPALAAAPASLLAFTAWRFGDGVLAGLALDRALDADPDYSLAHLLWEAIQGDASPADLDEVLLEDAVAAVDHAPAAHDTSAEDDALAEDDPVAGDEWPAADHAAAGPADTASIA